MDPLDDELENLIAAAGITGDAEFNRTLPDISDPLAQLGTWRKRVSQVEDLTAVLSLAPETPDKTSPAELVEAREFCMRYFMPMRSEVIVDLIERAGKAE